jgi:hypothetical protein
MLLHGMFLLPELMFLFMGKGWGVGWEVRHLHREENP